MAIKFIKGDLFDHPGLDGIGHGCNCAGAMGKGIAIEFRNRFPEMYQEYRRRCRTGEFGLGDVFLWQQSEPVVFNLGTQISWRSKATLAAIETSVSEMLRLAVLHDLRSVGLPRIGAGLGGLDWAEVRSALIRLAEVNAVQVIVFEEFVSRSG